ETDIQEKDKKKAKNKQNRARNGKDKVKSKPNGTNSKLVLIVNTVSTVVSTAEFLLFNLAKLLAEFAYLVAKAINTACDTKNHSLIRLRYNKPLYELMHDKKPDLSFLHVFGSLCYPTNDSEDLGKLNAKADIGIFVGYAPAKKAFRIYNRRTRKIMETIHVTFNELTTMASKQFGSGNRVLFLQLMTTSTIPVQDLFQTYPNKPCNPPNRDDWDHLFQPMFDEYFNPPTIAVSSVPVAAAPRAVDTTESPVSTSIDLDALSTSISSTQEQEHSPIIYQGFEESPKTPNFHDDPLHESLHEDLTSHGSSSNVRPSHTLFEHLGRWIKDHLIVNVIGDPSRSASTRKQLETDAMWCYFDAFLTSVEPKNFKQAMTEPSWIDAMQEEIHEFERLQMSFFLGLQISQSPRGIFLNQSKYASEIIKKYCLLSGDSVATPMVEKNKLDEDLQGTPVDATLYRGMIRSLMYLTSSRPDLIYAVCLCAWYSKDTSMSLTAYADADHAGCQDTRRNTSGSAQFLGDKLVSWSSKKQKSIAISSTEAGYIALSSAIALCCNNVQHSRAKHIDVRYHFIKEQVENGIVELYFLRTEYQLANIFTKPLPRERFNFLIEKLGMRSMSPETLKHLTEEQDE
ncbi:retrovirus-related pol polyprotein from transposon TNT 1-94, partial [Tanacetum coccineum]